jgi:NADH-quinone oxidoreductase subunit G
MFFTPLFVNQVEYHFVEMMACPGGCIGGGGEPKSDDPDILKKRSAAIYSMDERDKVRVSSENKAVMQLYKEDLGGKPLSETAHHLLHTHYADKHDVNVRRALRQGAHPEDSHEPK